MRNVDYHDFAAPMDFTIQSAAINGGRVGATVCHLMELSDTKDACLQYNSRLRLVFADYGQDPREITQIPAVRAFFQGVTAQWPYWLHYLYPEADNLAVFLSLLCRNVAPTGSASNPANPVRSTLDAHALRSLQHLTLSTLRLHDTMELPIQVTHNTGERLRNALCHTFV